MLQYSWHIMAMSYQNWAKYSRIGTVLHSWVLHRQGLDIFGGTTLMETDSTLFVSSTAAFLPGQGQLFITGDTHGEMHMKRLSAENWPLGKCLTKDDVILIAGDFGLVFHNEQTEAEKWWLDWLVNRPWTTVFVDGNHENHPKLAALPVETKFGAEVGVVAEGVYHLKRGRLYTICGKTVLAFGGATSTDKATRTPGVSWWPEELPNWEDCNRAVDSLEANGGKADLLISHAPPNFLISIWAAQGRHVPFTDHAGGYLDHLVRTYQFGAVYSGHLHEDWDYADKYHLVYNRIINV